MRFLSVDMQAGGSTLSGFAPQHMPNDDTFTVSVAAERLSDLAFENMTRFTATSEGLSIGLPATSNRLLTNAGASASTFMAGRAAYDWAGESYQTPEAVAIDEVFQWSCGCRYCGRPKLNADGTKAVDPLASDGLTLPRALQGGSQVALNSATGDPNIDALLGAQRYAASSMTFSFPNSTADYEANYGTAAASAARTAFASFAPVTELMRTAGRFTFQQVNALTGLTVTEVTGVSNFRMGLFTPAADGTGNRTAFAYLPTTSMVGGDSWYSNTNSFTSPARGNYAWTTILHEIGHNLGLNHGHETDGLSGSPMTRERDSMEFSLMTYRAYVDAPVTALSNEQFGFAQTFMMYDIAALQQMYGADFTTNSTDTTYAVSPISGEIFVNGVGQGAPGGNRVFATLWDGGGNDTYDFTSYNENMAIDLRAGRWSRFSTAQSANLGRGNFARGNIFNALQFNGDVRSLIENARAGGGSDQIVGNQTGNRLDAFGGNDTVNGGSGNDTLNGDDGNDLLIGDFFEPIVVIPPENPGVGSTGPSSQTIPLGEARVNRESALDLTANFSLNPNGDIQNSTTELHTSVTARGVGGAHWYQVTVTGSNIRFTIDIDNSIGGLDSFVRFIGPTATGSIITLAENDDSATSQGAGGSTAGLDSYLSYVALVPGTYWVVVGTFGNIDQLEVGTGYTMHISVAGQSRTTGETDNGTPGNDLLSGGNGTDTLIGGLGADVLDGGAGFDYASYQNATTGLTLFMGGGTFNTGEANGDIHTSIEGLIGSNFSDIIGGDANDNELHGLNGNDFVYGRGGVDRLIGGEGNDALAGGLDGDRLEGGAGIDVAFYRDATASVTASLLTGGTGGEALGDTYFDIENIWGSDFNDVLAGDNNGGQVYGFLGNDNLSGLGGDDFFYGGDGADTLDGGAGVDNFFFLAWQDQVNQFGTLERAEGGDTFTDFTSGTDRIILSRFWFGFGNIGGPAAALTETHANFVTNGVVGTTRPSLIWNAGARTLSFDADGNGARAAVLIGSFQVGAAMTLGDIWTA